VVVRASNFVSGAWGFFRAVAGSPSSASEPWGGITSTGTLDPSGESRLVVTVSPTAEPGPRSFLVINGTGVQTEYPDLFRIVARSLDVGVTRGFLVPGQGDGAVSVRGRLAVLESGTAFDPRTEEAEIRCGDMTAPLVVKIPAGDSRWRIHRGRMTWTSPRRATPRVRLLLDSRAGTFRLDVSRAVVARPTDAEIGVDFALGDTSGGSTGSWTEADDGSWRLGKPLRRPHR
jgi:hypothetical protein